MTSATQLVEGESYVTTPKIRSTARRVMFWVAIVLVTLLFGVISLGIAGSGKGGAMLSAANAGSSGAKGLIEVLKQDGVRVDTPNTVTRAYSEAGTGGGAGTTLAIYDPKDILDINQLTALSKRAQHVVLIDPSYDALNAFAPEIHQAGYVGSGRSADCDFPPVQRAGRVVGSGVGYRADGTTAGVTSCLTDSGDVSALVRLQNGEQSVTVFGIPSALTNDKITSGGNAALALGMFGEDPHLVWYLPTPADLRETTAPIPYPGWVPWIGGLFALVMLAAAYWRGRRFGPLVVERLPVTVRSSETMEGRARLYQKASARTHALDALRVGSIERLSRLVGLPRLATLDEVLGAVAAATGQPVADIRALLVDEEPRNDAALLRLSDRLVLLEQDVARATRPS
ncbi:MAG: hypothetical protein JWM02_3610 [Frankiales bacterium]|nr:hypothetical protein [Frankiales bacterium]